MNEKIVVGAGPGTVRPAGWIAELALTGMMFASTTVFAQMPMLPDDQAASLARARALVMTVPMQSRQEAQQVERTAPGSRNCSMTIGTQQPTDTRNAVQAAGTRKGVATQEIIILIDKPPVLVCQ